MVAWAAARGALELYGTVCFSHVLPVCFMDFCRGTSSRFALMIPVICVLMRLVILNVIMLRE